MTVDLETFFTRVWGSVEGTVCLSIKNKEVDRNGKPIFKDYFFDWPNELAAVIDKAKYEDSLSHDVYFVPAKLRGKSRKKIAFKSSNVAWVDIDGGTAPLEASLVVETSSEHYHAYWELEEPVTSALQLEETNRGLAKECNADQTGWDATQLLRVPYTSNYKRSTPVVIISSSAHKRSVEQLPKLNAPQLLQQLLPV